MEHAHRSLRYALTRAILVWAGVFFMLFGIIFMLTFDDLRNYTLQKVAEYRLNYQTQEFAKHLAEQDRTSIAEESDALVQDPEIAGIVLIDSSGELLHTSIHDERLTLRSFTNVTPSSLVAKIYDTPHLHLFQNNIPNSSVKLYLVLDDRPITRAIQTSTVIACLMLLMLLGLSIFALHRVLRIQLIEPLLQLKSIMGSGESMPDRVIRDLEDALPSEAGDILETYDHLVHAEHDMAQRLHDMLDSVPSCVWSASPGFHYIEASARAMQVFNCPPKQISGCELWSWLPDKHQREKNIKRLRKAVAALAPGVEMLYSIRNNGRDQWFGESISLYYKKPEDGQSPELAGLFGISNDITQRKAEETAMQGMQHQARKMEAVGTLVGGIAHEFNNMLAGIIGNVFLLKTEVEEGSKSAIRLARIERLGNRASGLVDQLLAFGRRNRVAVRDVDLIPLLENIRAIEEAGLPAQVQLTIDTSGLPDDKPVAVRADPSQLRQVLASLICNAIDACADVSRGEITLQVRTLDAESTLSLADRFPQLADSDLLCLSVHDNGSGIRKDLLERVFDPFFTTKEIGQGTGMGLAMVYGLMQGFGGAVELSSEPGVGTTVNLYLLRGDASRVTGVLLNAPDDLSFGQGQTVLVADDEELLRDAAAEMLEKLRYKPVVVENGKDAVQYMEQHGQGVALALLDLIMPEMNGTEAAARIREIRPDLPIVFITGYNLSESDSADLKMPRSQIVTKPYQISHLSHIMAALLRKKA